MKQCVKLGEVKQRSVEKIEGAEVIAGLIMKLRKWQKGAERAKESLLLEPTQSVADQIQENLHRAAEISDYISAVESLKLPERDTSLYKAIVFYRLKTDPTQANQLFFNLQQKLPKDVEVQLEVVKFVRWSLKNKFESGRDPTKEAE